MYFFVCSRLVGIFQNFMLMESSSRHPFVSVLFDSAERYWDPSILCVSALCSYCWVLFHCVDIISKESIYLLLDIWFVSILGSLQIRLLWIFLYKALCGHVLPFLLNKHLGVKWLSHRADVCLITKEIVSQGSCIILYSHWQWVRVPVPPCICGVFFRYCQSF